MVIAAMEEASQPTVEQLVRRLQAEEAVKAVKAVPRSQNLAALFARQRGEGQPAEAALSEAIVPADFALPDKPVRKPTKALAVLADQLAVKAGPLGRQGSWGPGPGRPTGSGRRQSGQAGRPAQTLTGTPLTGSLTRALQAKRKLRVDLSPAQKHTVCLAIAEEFRQAGASRN